MGVINLLFGCEALSTGGDSSLVLETRSRACGSFYSQFSSEELLFAMNGGECRDPELFKVLTVSDGGMLDPTQVTYITPPRLQSILEAGSRKTLSLRGRGGVRQNRALVTAWPSHSGAHCSWLTCIKPAQDWAGHHLVMHQRGVNAAPIPHRETLSS